jgi:biotin synthase
MPDINIAAATSLQAIDKKGKLMAITSGGNIIMPNITPMKYRNEYKIYDNKPINNDLTMKFLFKLKKDIETINHQMELNEWGDSHHFYKINQK